MSEKTRSAEEIQIYFLLNKVRYTKEDVDLDQVMGEIIHIMKNRKKIKNKSIFEAKEILNQNKDEIEDRTADIDEDMPGEFVKIKEETKTKMSKEKIIFTTKDEYDITEGMKYYSVKVKEYETHPDIKKLKGLKEPPLWSMCGPYINPEAHNPTGDIEYFYKKENAIEFINQNKEDE